MLPATWVSAAAEHFDICIVYEAKDTLQGIREARHFVHQQSDAEYTRHSRQLRYLMCREIFYRTQYTSTKYQ